MYYVTNHTCMMFYVMLYDILDVNTDCQNEKVPSETHPLTYLILLPNSLQITFWLGHPTEDRRDFFHMHSTKQNRKILFTI